MQIDLLREGITILKLTYLLAPYAHIFRDSWLRFFGLVCVKDKNSQNWKRKKKKKKKRRETSTRRVCPPSVTRAPARDGNFPKISQFYVGLFYIFLFLGKRNGSSFQPIFPLFPGVKYIHYDCRQTWDDGFLKFRNPWVGPICMFLLLGKYERGDHLHFNLSFFCYQSKVSGDS